MASILDTVSRHRKTLSGFAGLRDRALYIYGRILRRNSWSLPGRHAIAQVRLRGQRDPFHLRLASTDWLVLEEIFQQGEYACVPGGFTSGFEKCRRRFRYRFSNEPQSMSGGNVAPNQVTALKPSCPAATLSQ
jgi:hypothetical protein